METNNLKNVDLKTGIKEYRIAFKMQLYRGCEEEYKKRYAELLLDLKELLKSKGACEYSFF